MTASFRFLKKTPQIGQFLAFLINFCSVKTSLAMNLHLCLFCSFQEQIDKVFARFDADGDGRLSYAEFRKMMNKWWRKTWYCHLIKQLGSFLTHYICLLLTLEFWLKTKHKVLSNQSISSLRWIAPRKLYSKAWMFDMDHWCWR